MYIAIDIGGTNTRIASFEGIDTKSKIDYEKIPTSQNYKEGLKNIQNTIVRLVNRENIDSVGISIASGISASVKTIVNPNIPEWKAEKLVPDLESKFKTTVKIINDAAAGGLAEFFIGSGAKLNSFTFLTWGTGLGGVTIKRSKNTLDIYEYEPGHLKIDGDKRKCECGKIDCIESYVGGFAVEKRLGKKMATLNENEWGEVLDCMRAGINQILIMHPVSNIIFDGTVIIKHPDFVKKLEIMVNDDYPTWIKFSQSSVGGHAPLYGALMSLNKSLDIKFHKEF